jgi:hypothetical protein
VPRAGAQLANPLIRPGSEPPIYDTGLLPLPIFLYDKKVKLSHYTPRRRLGVEEIQLLFFLDLGTRWGCVVSFTPRPLFSPGERTPGTHCTGGWVGPGAGMDTEAREKILSPLPRIEPRWPVVQLIVKTLY